MAGPFGRLRGRVMTAAAVVSLACLAFAVTCVVAVAHGTGGAEVEHPGDAAGTAARASGHAKPHGRGGHGQGQGNEGDHGARGDEDGPPATPAPTASLSVPITTHRPPPVPPPSTPDQGAEGPPPQGPTAGVEALPATGPGSEPSPTSGSGAGGGVAAAPVIPPAPPIQQIAGAGGPIAAGRASASVPVTLEVSVVVVACLVAGLMGSRLLIRRR